MSAFAGSGHRVMTSYSRKCQNRTTAAQQLPRRRSIYLGLASTCQIREQFERRALLVMDTDVADLNNRADAAGAHVLVPTIDSAGKSKRPRDIRSGVTIPFTVGPRTVFQVATSPFWTLALYKTGMLRSENVVPYSRGSAASGKAFLPHTQHHCAASRIPRRVDGPVHAYPRAQPPQL